MAEDIPTCVDKFLFAEEIVKYVLRHNVGIQIPAIAQRYQNLVYNGFNDMIKAAVEFIENFVTEEVAKDFLRLKVEGFINREAYEMYASNLEAICFAEGFDAELFLYYCVHMGALAGKFYDDGELEAPVLAVIVIVHAFYKYDMFEGGWNILNAVAEKFASVAADVEDLYTPPTSASELSEEDITDAEFESESENDDSFELNLEESNIEEKSTDSLDFEIREHVNFSELKESVLGSEKKFLCPSCNSSENTAFYIDKNDESKLNKSGILSIGNKLEEPKNQSLTQARCSSEEK